PATALAPHRVAEAPSPTDSTARLRPPSSPSAYHRPAAACAPAIILGHRNASLLRPIVAQWRGALPPLATDRRLTLGFGLLTRPQREGTGSLGSARTAATNRAPVIAASRCVALSPRLEMLIGAGLHLTQQAARFAHLDGRP